MLKSFGNTLTEDVFHSRHTSKTRRFPGELYKIARRKLFLIHYAETLNDLLIPPGNHLETLKGNWKGFHSIRINKQWRAVFRWDGQHACEVQIVDYH